MLHVALSVESKKTFENILKASVSITDIIGDVIKQTPSKLLV
jgi:MinD-like ATPase involved in chromosome partitioning or flagellar assembly